MINNKDFIDKINFRRKCIKKKDLKQWYKEWKSEIAKVKIVYQFRGLCLRRSFKCNMKMVCLTFNLNNLTFPITFKDVVSYLF